MCCHDESKTTLVDLLNLDKMIYKFKLSLKETTGLNIVTESDVNKTAH